jgi:hypothetical protein
VHNPGFFDLYHETPHPALNATPNHFHARELSRLGTRSHRYIAYDERFRRSTMVSTATGTAKVGVAGIRVNYADYWCPAFQSPTVQGRLVEVLWDPYDTCGELLAHPERHPTNSYLEILELLYRTFRFKRIAAKATGLGEGIIYQSDRSNTTRLDTILRIAFACGTTPAALLFGDLGKVELRNLSKESRTSQGEIAGRISMLAQQRVER